MSGKFLLYSPRQTNPINLHFYTDHEFLTQEELDELNSLQQQILAHESIRSLIAGRVIAIAQALSLTSSHVQALNNHVLMQRVKDRSLHISLIDAPHLQELVNQNLITVDRIARLEYFDRA